jgi:hypothetical protein
MTRQTIKTAPKDGTRFLAWWPSKFSADAAAWATTWHEINAGGIPQWHTPWEYANVGDDDEPTHWMPDPGPPK